MTNAIEVDSKGEGAPTAWRRATLPGFTVVTKAGIRYSANHLSIGIADGDSHATLTFECSGRMYTKRADEVESIEYQSDGRNYCNFCDQPLQMLQPETR